MIGPASFDEELFVVLRPGRLVAESTEKLRQALNEGYHLYKKGEEPPLHVTIDRIHREDRLEAAEIAVKSLQATTTDINLLLEEFTCLEQYDNRFLVLKVKPTESLLEFSRDLHRRLKNAGISTLTDYHDWQYHITLINNQFVDKPLIEEEFERLCRRLDEKWNRIISRVSRLEIWRPVREEEKRTYFSIDLNERRNNENG
ncbi:2'-5' RNA ligase family protein [Halarsenatibacter silvermanii]|uniref:AKAP7 2'5' RNA ligase-like domain-containing protein n=1 Tax=Halarsenatibacter silvermanii TaxID=321763 RepID=A0A1G9QC90_9FIRM|nr:2'-5' RNA ligase family protein [Halarsenatibacter silvermanii]SDM08599.1 AKAP7 2'5' RNA ligase-like domain-containing protein [Halarsenatibacter silvermanii]